jgi:sugar lactone lactonase YvrE
MRIVRLLSFLAGIALLSPARADQYVISTYAGIANRSANLTFFGFGVATDADGNAYFTSNMYCVCVFKLDRGGAVTRIAGGSEPGLSGDGGPAVGAQLNRPGAIAADGAGNLYIADEGNNRVRKISAGGIITTVLDDATAGIGPPSGLAVDAAGNLYVAANNWLDGYHSQIRKVAPDGTITTVDAPSDPVSGLAADPDGNLYISSANRVRKVSADGSVTNVAGPGPARPGNNCSAGMGGDGGPAVQAPICYAENLTVDSKGNLFITELGFENGDYSNAAVRKVSADGAISTLIGDNLLWWGGQTATDAAGNLFVADGNRIRKVSADGTIATVAGFGACCYSGDGGPAMDAEFNTPHGIGIDDAGNLFIVDTYNNRIRKVAPDGVITTVAGAAAVTVNCLDRSAESRPAVSAQVCFPYNIAVDGKGNLYFPDRYRIRKVSADGVISVAAGNGSSGYGGEGAAAAVTPLLSPGAVAVDSAGNLYIHDMFRIRKISADGIIATIAGTGVYGDSGDGGPALDAQITAGTASVAVDRDGNVFFLDSGRVRKVSSSGIITTLAGGGKNRDGDGVPATSVQLSPAGLATDAAGNLFIADGARVRKVTRDGIISTIAGTGVGGYSGDYGIATRAQISANTLAVDKAGNIYFADSASNVVRVLRAQ